MDLQQNNIAIKSQINTALNAMRNNYPANGPQTPEKWQETAAMVRDIQARFPEQSDEWKRLGAVADRLAAGQGPAEGDNVRYWKQWQDDVKGVGDDLSNSMELGMIEIQSLTSQRQTAIQLVTGLMSKLNESSQAIAQKI